MQPVLVPTDKRFLSFVHMPARRARVAVSNAALNCRRADGLVLAGTPACEADQSVQLVGDCGATLVDLPHEHSLPAERLLR